MTNEMFEEAMREVARRMVQREMDERYNREIRDLSQRADGYRETLESDAPYGEDCSAGECERFSDDVSERVNSFAREERIKIDKKYGKW